MKKTLLFAFVLGVANYNFAQETGVQLDSVEITATRTIQNITRTGRNIQVISSQEISNLPVNSTDELLRYLPGIEIQSRGGFGVQSDLTLRGSTFNQVLVLVDGVRFNDPLTGHFNGYIPVPLAEIERVEVIKGTASSIYGADAVGGVINIITKTITKEKSLNVNASLKAGSFGYFGTDVSLLAKENKWKYSVGFQSNKSEGQQFENPNYETVASAPKNYNTWFNTHTVSGGLGREIGKNWNASLRASYDVRDFNAKYFYTASAFDESVEKTTVFFSDLKLAGTHGKFRTEGDLVYRQSTDHFAFNPAFSANDHITQFGFFQLNQTYQLSIKNTFVYGVQVDFRDIESSDRGNHSNFHSGVYGQWISNLVPHLTTILSLRGDYDNNYDFEMSPQLNISYVMNKWVIRGGVGKGIRAADYTERFVSNNLPALVPGRNLGNPDLAAESSWNYEIGTDYYVVKGFKLVTTGFYRSSSNLIDYVPTAGKDIINVPVALVPDGTYLYSRNLTSVNTFGIEVEAWYSKSFKSGNNLDIKLGYTGLSNENSDGEVSKYVSSTAKHLMNGNVSYSISKFDISLSGLYKMREEAYSNSLGLELKPTYFVTNANIGYRLVNSKVKFSLQVLNIFDEQYSDILGAKMPGRWIIAGVKLHI